MDITWLVFIAALIIGGIRTKAKNAKHFRELARLIKENEEKKKAIIARLEQP